MYLCVRCGCGEGEGEGVCMWVGGWGCVCVATRTLNLHHELAPIERRHSFHVGDAHHVAVLQIVQLRFYARYYTVGGDKFDELSSLGLPSSVGDLEAGACVRR